MTLFPDAGLVRAQPSDPDGVVRFRVSPASRLFEGHFDGAPILPGVAQIALAFSACAERALPQGLLQGVRDVRFSRPLGPGDEIELELTAGGDPDSIRFDLRTRGQSATSGLLLFAPGDDARG